MTKHTEFIADRYIHASDLKFHIASVRRALDSIEATLANDGRDADGLESQTVRRDDALWSIVHADFLAQSAHAVQTYIVGLARFEHATWQDIADELDVSKQAVSERYRSFAGPKRGDHIGTLTTESEY